MNLSMTVLGRTGQLFKQAVCFMSTDVFSARSLPVEAEFRTKDYGLHLIEQGPSTSVKVTRHDALKLYRQMTLIRSMEEEIEQLYAEQYIRGVCHNCIGQEALCVGAEAAIKPTDLVMGGYRCHGWVYTRGMSIRKLIAELLGRTTGCAKGKGGSMHLQTQNHFTTGILGSQVSVGTGFALALKHMERDNVALALYGDGAANQGQVYESFNIAKLWNLPVIYVCENNQIGMSTPVYQASAPPDFYKKVNFIPGIQADGTDVLAVREAVRFCREYCSSRKGPIVLELPCHRFNWHSTTRPEFRTEEDIAEVRKTFDPVQLFTTRLLKSGLANAETLADIVREGKKEVRGGIEAAKSDPIPRTRDAFTHVYHDPPKGYKVRGCDPWSMHDAA